MFGAKVERREVLRGVGVLAGAVTGLDRAVPASPSSAQGDQRDVLIGSVVTSSDSELTVRTPQGVIVRVRLSRGAYLSR